VRLVRGSRSHAHLRSGSSVRGAIDFVLVEDALRTMTHVTDLSIEQLTRVGELTLSSKVVPDESWGRTAEDIVRELVAGATS